MRVGRGSALARAVPYSIVRTVLEKAYELERAGQHIIHLEIGEPDFDTPIHVKEAAKRALDEGQVHYTSNFGIRELRVAIAEKLARENGLVADPDGEILVTVGATEAILLTLAALIDPGDEVMVPDPSWPNHRNAVLLVGGVPVPVPLREEDNFELDPEAVAARLSPRTRMLIVCTPQNPTGAVIGRKNLEAIARLAVGHDLFVMADEIYDRIVYDAPHFSIATLPGMGERTITINGFSKAYAMTGWRLGYLVGPRDVVATLPKVHECLTSCATTFGQYGAIAALRGPQDAQAAMVAEYKRRREMVVAGLNAIPGLSCATPGGAFYTFPNFKRYGLSSLQMADYLLERAGVALAPGSGFGVTGDGYLRLCYAASRETLAEGLARIRKALAELPLS